MSEGKKDSPHGAGAYGDRGQRNLLGEKIVSGNGKKSFSQKPRGFFDEVKPPLVITPQTEPIVELRSPKVKDYFKRDEVPDSVFVPSGVSYYKKLGDVPTEDFRNRNGGPRIDSIEERAAVVLSIAPPMEGEDEFASFKFVGERGLYVRVIKGYEERTHNGLVTKIPILRWVPFNSDESVLAGKIRRV